MERPASVDPAATWEASDNEWMLAPTNDDGEKHGRVTWWRPDGTRCCVTDYDNGTPLHFERFHENGETSRVGDFVNGSLHGTNTFTRSTAETTEVFPQGLEEGVWRCQMDYNMGTVTEARAYNKAGARVLEDGSPFPDVIPKGLPSSAHFRKSEGQWCWVDGTVRDNEDGTIARLGVWKWWNPQGDLVVTKTYEDGQQHGPEIQ